jgi:hypothetical protein
VTDVVAIHRRFMAVRDAIDERARRAESLAIGRGGIAAATRATGMACPVIRQGRAELQAAEQLPVPRTGRVRRPGGGRKKTVVVDPTWLRDLEPLVDPSSMH